MSPIPVPPYYIPLGVYILKFYNHLTGNYNNIHSKWLLWWCIRLSVFSTCIAVLESSTVIWEGRIVPTVDNVLGLQWTMHLLIVKHVNDCIVNSCVLHVLCPVPQTPAGSLMYPINVSLWHGSLRRRLCTLCTCISMYTLVGEAVNIVPQGAIKTWL